MKKLSQENKLLLKSICTSLNLQGVIDDAGNLCESKPGKNEVISYKVLGFIPMQKVVVKDENEPGKILKPLAEIGSMVLGIDYDPNEVVKSLFESRRDSSK
jgi:hypothetical protein